MSEIKVNSIKGVGASVAALSINNSDGTCTANITNNLSNKNFIINGEMKVCQRVGTTSTAVTNESKYVLDRFKVSTSSGGGTSLNIQQLHGNPIGAPYGFAASMKATVAVADDGGSDSLNAVQTRIENLDSNYLAFGTSQAKTVTLSFHVKSSLTGTFGGALVSGDFSKGYVFQYTISSADTWEKKTITISGDTASTADSVYNRGSATSLRGLVLYFDLGSGSNAEKSAANSWSATGTWGYGARIAGNVKLCANAGADWSITGIQLEEGSVATDFEHRSFSDELMRCYRYYQVIAKGSDGTSGARAPLVSGSMWGTGGFYGVLTLKNKMRTIPSLDVVNGTDYWQVYNNTTDTCDTLAYNNASPEAISLYLSGNLNGTAYVGAWSRTNNAAAFVAAKAEL